MASPARSRLALMLALSTAHCGTTQTSTAPKFSSTSPAPLVREQPPVVVQRTMPVVVHEQAPLPPSDRDVMVRAEEQSTGGARRVLTTARTLIDDEVVILGTCYTWLSAVYRQAGGRYSTVFSGDRRGRYASADQLQPGDWVHFINHSYGNGTHSAIFIGWVDRASLRALTASYPGERRQTPGRYRDYEFTSVYRIDRMRD